MTDLDLYDGTGLCLVERVREPRSGFGCILFSDAPIEAVTGRIDTAGGLGVCTIDPATEDERVLGCPSQPQPFDGRLELHTPDDGPSEVRLVGLRTHDEDWRCYDRAG